MKTKKMVLYLILVAMFVGHDAVYADVSSDSQVQDLVQQYEQRLKVIEQLNSQENELQSQLAVMNRQIFEYDQLIAALQPQIAEVASKIQSTQKAIADVKSRIASRDQLLKNRLRLMYADGNVSYLDVLFSSTDFRDFLDRITMLTMVLNQDEQLISTMNDDKSKLDQYNEQLQQQNSALLAQQNTLNSAKADQQKMINGRQSLLDQLQQQSNNETGAALQESQELKSVDAQLTPAVEAQLQGALTKNISLNDVWQWPLPASHTITSDFGPRGNEFHAGIDIGAPTGTPIVAVDDGVVLFSGTANGFGHWIVIKHANGLMSVYGHMFENGIFVTVGQKVTRDQTIGAVGSDGEATGPHLHFAVATGITGHQMDYIDPRPYLGIDLQQANK